MSKVCVFLELQQKLLKFVRVIHISKDDMNSGVSTIKPWDIVLKEKCVTNCHIAKCSDFTVKMWHMPSGIYKEAVSYYKFLPRTTSV